jgi:hypothetical protein
MCLMVISHSHSRILISIPLEFVRVFVVMHLIKCKKTQCILLETADQLHILQTSKRHTDGVRPVASSVWLRILVLEKAI